MYELEFTKTVLSDIAILKKSQPVLYEKVRKFLKELREHPFTGTGHPEALKNDKSGKWSRRIDKKHRLIYEVMEGKIVLLISAYGHYDDK